MKGSTIERLIWFLTIPLVAYFTKGNWMVNALMMFFIAIDILTVPITSDWLPAFRGYSKK